MKYIEELLKEIKPIEPIPTGVEPNYRKDSEIKAVIFDIYGTLLISSSGDVDQAEISAKNLSTAFNSSNILPANNSDSSLEEVLNDFENTIRVCHEEARKNNVAYPEIDILSVWEIVLIHAKRKKLIQYNGDANIMRMTVTFEFLSNKVYPMPGLHDMIQNLSNRQLPLGIVSNAQFYTPVLMNFFLNNEVNLNETIHFFDPELTVFSYKLGIGKPDTKLFYELVPVLKKKYGLLPNEVLFVGNDMLKDIYASKSVGFKTALFAGDKRSLRLRSDDKRVNGMKPDFTITDLAQLNEILK